MASVTYKIGGKYDGKAVKSAKTDLKSLGDSVKGISTVIKGLAVVKLIQEVNKLSTATKGVFIEQNKALSAFNVAVKQSGQSITKLNDLKKELSNGNFIDDDSLNNALKFGMQMGLTGERLEVVTKAAVNMAASGIKPLDKAMKELTTTELKNSDAVDEIAKKYDGFAQSMSNTFSGRNQQWNNSISDLKAAIGSIPASLEFITKGKLLEPLNKITNWLVQNRNYIINFFLHLPEVFTETMNTIGRMIKKTFTNLPELLSTFGPLFIAEVRDKFTMMYEIAKAAFKGIADLLDWALGNPFRKVKDSINGMLNHLIEGINTLYDKLPDWIKKLMELLGVNSGEAITFRFSTNNADGNKTWEETAKSVSESIKKAGNAVSDGTKKLKEDWLKILDATTDFYGDDIKLLGDKLEVILGQDLPDELQNALNGLEITPTNTNINGNGDAQSSSKTDYASQFGELGSVVSGVIKGIAMGDWSQLIATLLGKVVGIMESASEIISNALNSVTYFLNAVLPPVIRFMENVLAPILPFIQKVGAILGDVFRLLEPIFSAIGANLIKMVLSTIITLLDLIYNAVVAIHNIFTSSAKDWAYRDVTADNNEIWNAASTFDASSSLASSSASNSISSAKDVYVNIYYNNSYVNGDAREIALSIRDEIAAAERMGY